MFRAINIILKYIVKDLIKKYLGWMKDSNRPKHMKAGMLIYAVMLSVCFILGADIPMSSSISFFATCIVAVAVDYKDKLYGNTFDWLDVAATVIVPGIAAVLLLIL